METNEATPSKPKWFSIREAAEYLDVGEPTLYRWMREGKITYRKVGDSTRFWQQDLDSVMQVYHSDGDLDKARQSRNKNSPAVSVKSGCSIEPGNSFAGELGNRRESHR